MIPESKMSSSTESMMSSSTSTSPSSSTSRTWARHYHDAWQRRAGDPRLPYWLRVTAAAYGAHDDNGHARFKRGDLSLVLGQPDPDSGRVVRFSNVGRAIDDAVAYGWLAPGSYWGCLVVPAHDVRKGALDHRPAVCPLHERHATEAAKTTTRHLSVVRGAS